jgi:hypothetical protein
VIYPASPPGRWTPAELASARVHERAHTYQYEVFGFKMVVDYGGELLRRGYYDRTTGVGNRYEEAAHRYEINGGSSWFPF